MEEEYNILTEIENELSEFDLLLSKVKMKRVFKIDCSKMIPYEDFIFKNRKEGYLGNLFKTLDSIPSHCLYWFEYNNKLDAEKAESKFTLFKIKKFKNPRTTPALNKNKNSKYFYVGVRQGGVRKKDGFTNIASRIFQHLGYYSKGSTQGLQLIHWEKSIIKLSIIELPIDSMKHLNILEKFYANKLNPLLGKH